jgi:4'-phosphopantetheinyl transferase
MCNESWLPGKPGIQLHGNEIHVWRAELNFSQGRMSQLERWLSQDELERAVRYYRRKDRDQYVVTRGLLRELLGLYLNQRPDQIRFVYGRFGKPAVAETPNGQPLEFNVSHSGDLALFGFARSTAIGVDLEKVDEDLEFMDIARQYFTDRERTMLERLEPSSRVREVYALWTDYEARLKASGQGISGLDEHAQMIAAASGDFHSEGGIHDWDVERLAVGQGYVASLAAKFTGENICYWLATEQSLRAWT